MYKDNLFVFMTHLNINQDFFLKNKFDIQI